MKLSIEEIGYLEALRQRIGLDDKDSSCDSEILEMNPFDRVKLLCGWYLGDEYWATQFKSYCESQGIYLTDNPDAEGIL